MTTKPKCFVLMPFDDDRKEIYDLAIRRAAAAAGFDCHRADDTETAVEPGAIIKEIVQRIFRADVLIADISQKNANVFYELGVAHTVANKTIIICERDEVLPFNLNAYRVIFYDKTLKGGDKLQQKLEEALCRSAEWKPEPTNPVQDFRPVKYAVPLAEQAKLEAEIERLRGEVERLKKVELRILMLTLPIYQFRHLLYLSSGDDYIYDKHTNFVEELRKLRALGLIKSKEGVKISGIPDNGNLKEYVEITELAKRVVEELLELTRESPEKKIE